MKEFSLKILIVDDERDVAEKMAGIIRNILPWAVVTICTMTYVKGRAPPVRMPDLLEVEQQIVANDLVLLDHGLGDIEYNGTKLANLCQQLGKLYIGISAHVSFCKVEFMAKHELDVHPMFVTTLENVILGEVAKIQHESVH